MARPRRYALPTPKRSPWPRIAAWSGVVALGVALAWWWRHAGNPGAAQAGPATNRPAVSGRTHPQPSPAATAPPQPPIQPPTNRSVVVVRPDEYHERTPSKDDLQPAIDPGVPWPRPVETVFEAQVALSRLRLSPGSLDALWGPKTRAALMAFQTQRGLPHTGSLDARTRSRLLLEESVLAPHTVTSNEIASLRRLGRTWLEKSSQDYMGHETLRELVAELGRCSPDLLERLNPGVDWSQVKPGTTLQIPRFPPGRPVEKAAFARLRLAARTLQVFGEATNLLAHFPVSVARFADKRPVGQLHVAVIIPDPNYTFDPENFPGSIEGRHLGRKLVLQPGPNNPVGKVWVGLDREGYGIHGTPSPETVGRAESAGCFRLTNWDVGEFVAFAWIGMPVLVEP